MTVVVDLDPGEVGAVPAFETHVASLVDELTRRVDGLSGALSHQATSSAREDLGRIAAFLERELDRSDARSVVLYASGRDDVWEELRLGQPAAPAVHAGRAFVLTPLLEALERDRDVILAAVSRDRGLLWRLRNASIEPVADLSRDGQGQHDQGGWSQARYARSRENEALGHFRAVAHAVGEQVSRGSSTLVVVDCLDEQRSAFEGELPAHVSERMIGWTAVEAHAGPDALRPQAEELLDARLADERAALLDRWREQAPAGRAASRWEEAVTAAWDGRIETALVDGRTHDAWECPTCGRGYAAAGVCEVDAVPLEDALGGALELVVRGTLRHGGEVRHAGEGTLDETDGVAAILRYAAG